MKEKLLETILRYVDNSKEGNDLLNEILNIIDSTNYEKFEREVKSRREQILDINQWSSILLTNKGKIRDRVLWAMIGDINNRTTD